MTTKHDCQCPPFPHFSPGSLAGGSSYEAEAHRRWESEHGDHDSAPEARLPPVWLDARQIGTYRQEMRRHLAKNGDSLMQIAPHHLKALLDAAALADVIPEKTQEYMDKALAALRTVPTDGEAPDDNRQAVMAARDLLREAGAKNT
jgi:hypothetical protein